MDSIDALVAQERRKLKQFLMQDFQRTIGMAAWKELQPQVTLETVRDKPRWVVKFVYHSITMMMEYSQQCWTIFEMARKGKDTFRAASFYKVSNPKASLIKFLASSPQIEDF